VLIVHGIGKALQSFELLGLVQLSSIVDCCTWMRDNFTDVVGGGEVGGELGGGGDSRCAAAKRAPKGGGGGAPTTSFFRASGAGGTSFSKRLSCASGAETTIFSRAKASLFKLAERSGRDFLLEAPLVRERSGNNYLLARQSLSF
jgi:hypothetical protein